ncbi:hypothetical protein [Streptomyces sp. NPDC051219]|uniref:hypothetical protein n=1 Tax=Streptomyces sp. NPDC051219 TaxID=3155283 RepID=UPI003426DE4C
MAPQLDPYRFPGAEELDWHSDATGPDDADDHVLPAPDPAQRLPCPMAASDRRRLDLHAALTAKGVAPLAGDVAAIGVLSELDGTTFAAVLRWITWASGH